MSVISKESFSLLIELGILKADERGAEVNLLIDRYLLENDCCKTAYLLGAFIGAGSVTIPNGKTTTSYHLEFVFSNYATAQDFSALLSELGFLPKLTKRKDSHIVYFKNGDDIADVLFTLGATKCGFEVKDIVVKKTMNNDINRRFNCDISNINKQIEASIKQVKDITLIEETIGLDSLSPTLKSTAKLRLENRSATLEEMAKISGLTKSCLNHRLRKIAEIARNL
jgi:DNA-binding protein WhiA